MKIEELSVTRSAAHARAWRLHMQVNGLQFDGWFDDMRGFLTAVSDAAVFFCYRAGKMRLQEKKPDPMRECVDSLTDIQRYEG